MQYPNGSRKKGEIDNARGRGGTAVAISLGKQNGMQSSRAQVDRLALERSIDS